MFVENREFELDESRCSLTFICGICVIGLSVLPACGYVMKSGPMAVHA